SPSGVSVHATHTLLKHTGFASLKHSLLSWQPVTPVVAVGSVVSVSPVTVTVALALIDVESSSVVGSPVRVSSVLCVSAFVSVSESVPPTHESSSSAILSPPQGYQQFSGTSATQPSWCSESTQSPPQCGSSSP